MGPLQTAIAAIAPDMFVSLKAVLLYRWSRGTYSEWCWIEGGKVTRLNWWTAHPIPKYAKPRCRFSISDVMMSHAH